MEGCETETNSVFGRRIFLNKTSGWVVVAVFNTAKRNKVQGIGKWISLWILNVFLLVMVIVIAAENHTFLIAGRQPGVQV